MGRRLCREDFAFVLRKIAPLIARNEVRAIASSGSSISPELRLLNTLRTLAGAKYLDMIWYRVHVDHVHELVMDCVNAINSTLQNIGIPATEAEWLHETEQFREVLQKKHGSIGVVRGMAWCGGWPVWCGGWPGDTDNRTSNS
jgi:hypothetical protein